jgi:DNA polymerase-1
LKNERSSKAILIDGNNIAYRAFYAIPDNIATSSGVITNAVLGFTNMLLKLIEDQNPDTIICAFDSKVPTFRHKIFDRYKIHRKKMPDELSKQFPLIKEVLDAFGITYIEKDGFEADDILAALAGSIRSKYDYIIIVTGDKDILQLVSDNIKVMGIKRGITDTLMYDEKVVEERFGVSPERIKDLLALMGDSSDDIPGVPGIGPKTAKTLVKKYGCIEDIYRNINKVENQRVRQLLIDNEEIALLSKKLTSLKTDQDINIKQVINNSFKKVSFKKVKNLFDILEFRSLQKRLGGLKDRIDFKDDMPEVEKETYRMDLKHLTSDLSFDEWGEEFNKHIYIADFKNEDGSYGIILSPGDRNAYHLDVKDLKESAIKKDLMKLMGNKEVIKSGFNLKKIYKLLKGFEIELKGKFIDYEILYLILNPIKAQTDLEEIIRDIISVDLEDIEISQGKDKNFLTKAEDGVKENQLKFELFGVKKPEIKSNKEKLDEALKKISLYKKIENELLEGIKKEVMEELYNKVEEPLIKVLAEMEYTGVNIDREYLNSLIKKYDIDIKGLKKDIYRLCGEEFNINSSQQLSEILYKKLRLPITKRTKTGISTDASSLRAIYESSPVIEKILDYREKTKLKNTYIDVLPGLIDHKDFRVHTTYSQLGTSTGRISSSEPNLQNIPVRTEYGKQIRKAFIPGEGYDLILASDYSQIELRVLAHLSGDENLIRSFESGEDIHVRTASEIFDVSYDDVDDNLRRRAKTINFGIIYGMTEYGLKSRLSIPEEEARDYISKYFERYSGVKKYLKFLKDEAYKKGYSTTIFGRKRYIRELGSSNERIRSLGERFAVNTPIQGSAADIMKLSTVKLFEELESKNVDSNIILHVHDELVLELKEQDLEKVRRLVIESMENCIGLKVRIKVDIKTGRNWYI